MLKAIATTNRRLGQSPWGKIFHVSSFSVGGVLFLGLVLGAWTVLSLVGGGVMGVLRLWLLLGGLLAAAYGTLAAALLVFDVLIPFPARVKRALVEQGSFRAAFWSTVKLRVLDNDHSLGRALWSNAWFTAKMGLLAWLATLISPVPEHHPLFVNAWLVVLAYCLAKCVLEMGFAWFGPRIEPVAAT